MLTFENKIKKKLWQKIVENFFEQELSRFMTHRAEVGRFKDDNQSEWENLKFCRSPYKDGWTYHHN